MKLNSIAEVFPSLCAGAGLPAPVPEFAFAANLWLGGIWPDCPHNITRRHTCLHCGARRRQWRFDWCFDRLAVEQVGGVWTRGRHSRGKGQIGDMEKHNAAVMLGYQILYFTPDQMADGTAIDTIATVLGRSQPEESSP